MQKYKSNITTTSGSAVRGAPVHVLDESGSPAPLFLDRAGTVAAANPLVTGADGTFYFYAVNGRYSLRTTVEGASITDADVVLLMDPEEITVAGPIAEATQRAEAAAQRAEAAIEDSGIPEMVSAAQEAIADANLAVQQAGETAGAVEIARQDVAAVAAQFGDVAGAISAAESAKSAAQASAGQAALSEVASQSSKTGAEGAKAQAEAAKVAAEAARDASFVTGPKYATEAAGRAAVADGVNFLVQGAGDVAAYEYRRLNAGASDPIAAYPSASAVRSQRDSLSEVDAVIGYPTLPVPNGTGAVDGSHWVFATPVSFAGVVGRVSLYARAAGKLPVRTYARSGDTFTVIEERTVQVVTGAQSLQVDMKVNSGEYLGFQGEGILSYSSATGSGDSGGVYYGAAGSNSFVSATPSPTLRIFLRFDVLRQTRVDSLENEVYGLADDLSQVSHIGYPTNPSVAGSAVEDSNYVFAGAFAEAGTVRSMAIYAAAAGVFKIRSFDRVGNKFTLAKEVAVTVPAGASVVPLRLRVKQGQYIGFQAGGVATAYSSGATSGGFYGGGPGLTSFTSATANVLRIAVRMAVYYRRTLAELVGAEEARPSGIPWQYNMVLGVGQSLMEGSVTIHYPGSAITTAQEYDSLGFAAYNTAPTALYPATVANTQRDHPTLGLRGEWPGLGCAASIRRALLRDSNLSYTDVKSTVVVANTASDGQRIGLIGKGSIPYEAGVAKAAALRSLVGGASAGVMSVIFAQGESDGPLYNNTDPSVYLTLMKQLAENYDADLRAATGQSKSVPMICYQTGSTGPLIARAQLRAAKESGLIYMACPMYQFDYYDRLHINPVSSRRLGGYYGEAVKCVSVDGNRWEPLWPVACEVSGNYITLTFNKEGLVLDTALVPAQVNSGFSVSGTTITSVAVINSRQVRLLCSSAPSVGATLTYGAPAVGKGPYVGEAGNLRDSRGDAVKFDGFPLHNWSVLFDWTI